MMCKPRPLSFSGFDWLMCGGGYRVTGHVGGRLTSPATVTTALYKTGWSKIICIELFNNGVADDYNE